MNGWRRGGRGFKKFHDVSTSHLRTLFCNFYLFKKKKLKTTLPLPIWPRGMGQVEGRVMVNMTSAKQFDKWF
jgi:hypothetical protein